VVAVEADQGVVVHDAPDLHDAADFVDSERWKRPLRSSGDSGFLMEIGGSWTSCRRF
jgi:hypothetical protein